MHVLSVISLKGGVGKTTVALGLAGAALERGIPALVVDLDPQANATLGLDPKVGELTVADVLDDPRKAVVQEAIRPTSWVGDRSDAVLDVLPGHPTSKAHDEHDPALPQLRRLATALSRLEDRYELVLVDCPPSLGRLTRGALVASRHAMVVTEPGYFSVHGATRAFNAIQVERQHNTELQPLGVAVNRYRERSPEHRFRLEELRKLFGPLVLTPPLSERSAVQQAQGTAQPVQRDHSPGAKDVAAIFDTYLGRLMRAGRTSGRK